MLPWKPQFSPKNTVFHRKLSFHYEIPGLRLSSPIPPPGTPQCQRSQRFPLQKAKLYADGWQLLACEALSNHCYSARGTKNSTETNFIWSVSVCSKRKPPATVRSPHSQNGTMAKDAWWVRRVYWRRERAHDKIGERVVFIVCTAGASVEYVDKVKSE